MSSSSGSARVTLDFDCDTERTAALERAQTVAERTALFDVEVIRPNCISVLFKTFPFAKLPKLKFNDCLKRRGQIDLFIAGATP